MVWELGIHMVVHLLRWGKTRRKVIGMVRIEYSE